MPGNHGIVKEKKKLIRMPKTEKKKKKNMFTRPWTIVKANVLLVRFV
jgi:hypothetical protein